MEQRSARFYASQGIAYTLYALVSYVMMVVALWGVFIYVPTEKMQGIVQRIFYFHVSSALTMFLAFFVVFVASIACLLKDSRKTQPAGKYDLEWWDSVAVSAAELGVLFCTLVLLTGPIWARPIWGTWWSWDPTLTLTLVLWLIYIAYLMLRAEVHDARRTRFAAILGIIGFVDVPLIRWSVEKWRTLHPKPVVLQEGGRTGLSPAMMLTFLLCLAAFLLLFFLIMRERLHLARMRHEIDALRDQTNELLSP